VSIFISFQYFSRNYFSKVARSEPAIPTRKQNLTRNSQSYSVKVMHFGITEKPTRDCVSLFNNAGLISKVSEKNSQRKRWILPFSTTPLSFDAPFPGNFSEYSHKPYTARNYSHWPTFLWPTVWVYLHSLCGLRKMHLFCNRVPIGRSKSSNVVDFGTNRKGVCDFLLVINSNFGPILHHFATPLSFNALTRGEPFRISGWTSYRQD